MEVLEKVKFFWLFTIILQDMWKCNELFSNLITDNISYAPWLEVAQCN